MDFANLLIAPVAAAITVIVVTVALLAGKYSEPRIPVLSFCASLIVIAVIVQPWFYASLNDIVSAVTTMTLLTLLGFAIGSLFILTPLKLLRR